MAVTAESSTRFSNALLKRNAWLSALLLLLLAVGLERLLREAPSLRRDLSEDQLFELSPATHGLLERLGDVLVVEAFFTGEVRLGTVQIAKSRLVDQLRELEAAGHGRVRLEMRDPNASSEARLLAERLGLQPVPLRAQQGTSSVQQDVFFGLRLSYAGREEVLPFVLPQTFEYSFAEALSRLLRSQAPVVAFVEGSAGLPSAQSAYTKARDQLARSVSLRLPAALDSGLLLPADTQLLVLARPRELHPRALFAVDQYLQRGGRLLLLLDRHEVSAKSGTLQAFELNGAPRVQPAGQPWIDTETWLASYGLVLSHELVWDLSSIDRSSGQQRVQYPYWVRVLDRGLATSVVAVGRLPGADFLWTQAFLRVSEGAPLPVGLERIDLVQSSERSWFVPPIEDLRVDAGQLNALSAELLATAQPAPLVLALSLSGRCASPFSASGAPAQRDPVEEQLALKAQRPALVERSQEAVLSGQTDFQIVALADSDCFSDDFLSSSAQNQLLLENLVGWLTLDDELVALRARLPRDRRIADFLEQERSALGLSNLRGALDAAQAADYARREEQAADAAAQRRWGWMAASTVGALALLALVVLGVRSLQRLRLEHEVRA